MNWNRSAELFREAVELMPDGVNSPVSAYQDVGGAPTFLAKARGARVMDVDGNDYVDLVLGYGPQILGHAHPRVTAAIQEAANLGTAFGGPTEGKSRMAKMIRAFMPSVEMVRLVNSETEATMSALRLARAVTGRPCILNFNGCDHGHGDAFLVAEYNDLLSVEAIFRKRGAEIACIVVEPVAGDVGCVLPAKGFLDGLRRIADVHGALLIFDEVMTGFRVARGGYTEISGVQPDLVTLGKVLGGGLPVGAFGGRRDLMLQISPTSSTNPTGLCAGNPLAVAAGLAALSELEDGNAYDQLEDAGAHLQAGLEYILSRLNIPGVVQRQGSMLCLYFSKTPITNLSEALATDREAFRRFFHRMRENGVLLPPSPFACWFLSTAHDTETLDQILEAARNSLSPKPS